MAIEPTHSELLALLYECSHFVFRAKAGSTKRPHAQDKEDAEALWPRLEAALRARETA